MSKLYKSLTDFLPILENDKIGDWVVDRVCRESDEIRAFAHLASNALGARTLLGG